MMVKTFRNGLFWPRSRTYVVEFRRRGRPPLPHNVPSNYFRPGPTYPTPRPSSGTFSRNPRRPPPSIPSGSNTSFVASDLSSRYGDARRHGQRQSSRERQLNERYRATVESITDDGSDNARPASVASNGVLSPRHRSTFPNIPPPLPPREGARRDSSGSGRPSTYGRGSSVSGTSVVTTTTQGSSVPLLRRAQSSLPPRNRPTPSVRAADYDPARQIVSRALPRTPGTALALGVMERLARLSRLLTGALRHSTRPPTTPDRRNGPRNNGSSQIPHVFDGNPIRYNSMATPRSQHSLPSYSSTRPPSYTSRSPSVSSARDRPTGFSPGRNASPPPEYPGRSRFSTERRTHSPSRLPQRTGSGSTSSPGGSSAAMRPLPVSRSVSSRGSTGTPSPLGLGLPFGPRPEASTRSNRSVSEISSQNPPVQHPRPHWENRTFVRP